MKNKILALLILIVLAQLKTFAIDIIYPKSNGANIYANATFFVGNSDAKNNLYLNGEQIEILENGSFLKYVPLNMGENTFFFEEKNKDNGKIISTLNFKINRLQPPESCVSKNNEITCQDKIYVARVIQDNVPIRNGANEDAKRLSHLDSNTILVLNGKQKDFYRVMLEDNKYAWIAAKHISEPVEIESQFITKIEEIKYISDNDSYSFLYKLKFPVPYVIEEHGNNLLLNLYNVDTSDYDKTNKKQYIIEPQQNNVLMTYFKNDNILWGYDVKYEKGYLKFSVKKPPQINKKTPLKDIKIMIDPGHGGCELGAVGPTRVKESDINLNVAKKLKTLLEEQGAIVCMTREDNSYVDLYDRIKMAKEQPPVFLISLHANALPDGGNPELKHGTSVFYYYPQAKKFAETMQSCMLKKMGTKNDGIYKRSFVLTRNSSSLSLLIEMAYMVHPKEYTLLLNDNFRQVIAESIKDGLEQYLIENVR